MLPNRLKYTDAAYFKTKKWCTNLNLTRAQIRLSKILEQAFFKVALICDRYQHVIRLKTIWRGIDIVAVQRK
jgi:hypothetical protein